MLFDEDENRPHCAGRASCESCGHGWIAVWPAGADNLECPMCGSTDTDREIHAE